MLRTHDIRNKETPVQTREVLRMLLLLVRNAVTTAKGSGRNQERRGEGAFTLTLSSCLNTCTLCALPITA